MPAPRSPEIITEPVVPGLADTLAQWIGADTHDIHMPDAVVSAASEFVRYWQAVGPRLAGHGYRARAELEATFDLAFQAAGLDWKCYGSRDAEIMVTTPDHRTPPLFCAIWRVPDGSSLEVYGGKFSEPCWYSEHGAWGQRSTGTTHATIADLIEHHRGRA